MKEVLQLLDALSRNNNREWFEANKEWYKRVNAYVIAFAERLIDGVALFDTMVRGLTVKDCTYRIYRDIRFSNDKTPYKTHIGIYICPGGKKSSFAGYYLHIEPQASFVVAGLYCPETKVLNSVREDIFSLTSQFEEAKNQATTMKLDYSSSLKRVPRQFPADSPSAEYLKLKNIMLERSLSNDEIVSDSLLTSVLAQFQSAKSFNDFINRAVAYSDED